MLGLDKQGLAGSLLSFEIAPKLVHESGCFGEGRIDALDTVPESLAGVFFCDGETSRLPPPEETDGDADCSQSECEEEPANPFGYPLVLPE
ncbi:hypothetical protein GCM10023075_81020 [Streptosporangium album]